MGSRHISDSLVDPSVRFPKLGDKIITPTAPQSLLWFSTLRDGKRQDISPVLVGKIFGLKRVWRIHGSEEKKDSSGDIHARIRDCTLIHVGQVS